jgi:hypothetical protein
MDNKKSKNEKPDEITDAVTELNESEMEKVTGGRGVIKTVDTSSAELFLHCTHPADEVDCLYDSIENYGSLGGQTSASKEAAGAEYDYGMPGGC